MNIPDGLSFALVLFVAMALAAVAAKRLRIPAAIVLLFGGFALAFAPGVPRVHLEANVVLLGLLPPLLYSSGVGMSWRGFKANLRPILLLAIGCVLLTAAAVAALVHCVFDLPWAVGFVLGAIVSPPDSVAPMAIARRLSVPNRILVVLEGESLFNDATALILFGFALSAVATGEWSATKAIGKFMVIACGEPSWGIATAWLALQLRKRANDSQVEISLAFLTPFAAFWPPYLAGGSGVLAAVAAGLYVSWNGARFISPATRLQGFFIWDFVDFVITGALFLLTGMQARALIEQLGATEWVGLLLAGGLVTLTVIVVRFVWVYLAAYLPRLLSARIRRRDPIPPRSYLVIVGFTGIRGGECLAAALLVPVAIGTAPFPGRDLVLLSTYCVIAVTLVGQGLMLPWVIGKLSLAPLGRAEANADRAAERRVRIAGIDAALGYLEHSGRDSTRPSLVRALRTLHAHRRARLAASEHSTAEEAALRLELIATQRRRTAKSYADDCVGDGVRRRIERELDLEEALVRHSAHLDLDEVDGAQTKPVN
jgi:CPA1 family monovalent cation:H+ antiporter